MMMFYRRRASPKHRYDIIEVDYGGGGHHTRLRDQEINCCVYGVPPSVYKGEEEEGADQGEEARPRGGNPTPSRIPPSFLVQVGEGKEGKEKEKEGEGGKRGKGAGPQVQFGLC